MYTHSATCPDRARRGEGSQADPGHVFLIFALRLSGKRASRSSTRLIWSCCSPANTVQNAIIGEDNSVTGGIIGAATLLGVNIWW